MSLVERFQSLLVAVAAGAGMLVGFTLPVSAAAGRIVLPTFLLMLTAVFVQLDATQLSQARQAGRLVGASLVLNFGVTPVLAWVLGAGLLGDAPDLRLGLLLLLVTPCTDWYLVFTSMARGHMGIAAALLPVNLTLQFVLLPVYIMLLGGPAVLVDLATLVESVLVVLVIPFALALITRWFVGRRKGAGWRERYVVEPASRLVLPLLGVAVTAMFAWQAPTVAGRGHELLRLLAPLAVFFVVLLLIAVGTSRLLRLPPDQKVTLTMVVTARNSPTALAFAIAAFPGRPLIALALVVGPLVELPVLAVVAQVVRVRSRKTGADTGTATTSPAGESTEGWRA